LNQIMQILQYLREFSLASVVVRLALAVMLGACVGIERERHGRAAGLRTHALVCLGAALATLIGHYNISELAVTSDPMRIGAQVVSGIGFLGAGTILSKGRFHITGLTTAAGLWATAAIGLAIGIGFYEGAIIGTLFATLTMTFLSRFDSHIVKRNRKLRMYIEVNEVQKMTEIISLLENVYGAHDVQVTVPRSGISNSAGIEVTIRVPVGQTPKADLESINAEKCVAFALHSI